MYTRKQFSNFALFVFQTRVIRKTVFLSVAEKKKYFIRSSLISIPPLLSTGDFTEPLYTQYRVYEGLHMHKE